MTGPILFDLETRADHAIDVPEFWQAQDIQAPANYKDPLKIADYIDKAEAAVRTKMALSPVTGVIVCIGVQVYADDDPVVFTATEPTREGELAILKELSLWLSEEWDEKSPFITYNGRLFDLPFIAGRAMVQDVPLRVPRGRDYRRHVDLYDDVFGKEGSQSMWQFAMGGGLKPVTGSALLSLPLPELAQHCKEDIEWLGAMAQRTELIWGER
jgi:uncharacterized protein YprB with RNaseH-like and TPR domain|tara:strand:+ start:4677 stop:5315 length:639 start_codon:yes stop_codon:yes gene_type:complete